jgi:hypothetical protein
VVLALALVPIGAQAEDRFLPSSRRPAPAKRR